MKKMFKKTLCGVLAIAATVASVGTFAACETDKPQVEMQIEFDGKTYTLEYTLYRKLAPTTVNHFIALVENGYYDGVCVHDYDVDGEKMYTGAYTTGGSENGGIVYKNYYDIVKTYENFPVSVWEDTTKATPTYTLYGEFSDNGFNVGTGALKQEFGSLTMYYTEKDVDDKIAIQRAKDGEMDWRYYKNNSATSMFSINLSTSAKSDAAYCTFATLNEDSEDELQTLLDAIAANEDFVTEYTVEVDGDNAYVIEYENTATYSVPNEMIVIKKAKVTKY